MSSLEVAKLPPHPDSVAGKKAEGVLITEQTLSVSEKNFPIFSRQTSPEGGTAAKGTVLLLHGQAFTSQNWQDIGTLQRLALWGYRAVGVDLPGYGKSSKVSLGNMSRADFMKALVSAVGGSELPVIVSPSMSGGFSLPYLFEDPKESCSRACAYIPVAPVSTQAFRDKYPHSQLRTLIVYGSRDESLGLTSLKDLKALPKATVALIPEAGHACYMNQPDLWHNVLHHFLTSL